MAISDIEQWCQDRSATMVFWAEGTNFQALKSWADGDELTATNLWSDESGNGNNASPLNDTSTNRPIYRDGSTTEIGLNNKPAIEFTGDAADSEGVSTGTVLDTSAMPYTLLCVHRARHYSTVRPIHAGVDPDQAAFGWPKTEGGNIAHFDVGAAGGGPSPEEDITSAPIIGPIAECITYDSSITAFFNGSQMATSRTDLPSNTNTGLVLGSKNESGSQVTMDGWIAFAAVLPGEISQADRATFFRWAQRYGISSQATAPDGLVWPRERWELHRTGTASGSGTLSFASSPPQGTELIAVVSSSAPATSVPHTGHTVREDDDVGTEWTKITGVNADGNAGSISVWHKTAGASETTDVYLSNGGSGAITVEVIGVKGLTGTVLQSNEDAGGTGTSISPVLTSGSTQGSWIFAAVFHDADPGTITDWTGGYMGHVDELRLISASKIAGSGAGLETGTVTWTTSDTAAWVIAEFAADLSTLDVEPAGPTITVTAGTAQVDLEIVPSAVTVTAGAGTLTVAVGGGVQDITPAATTITVAAGTLDVDLNVVPTAVTVTAGAGTLTITTGVVDITPAATTVNVTPGTLSMSIDLIPGATTVTASPGTLEVDLNLVPAATTVTAGAGSLTVTVAAGPQDITPAATTVNVTPGTLSMSIDVVPAAVTVTAGAGTLTITTGAVDITPDPVTVTALAGSLTITTGAVDITPDPITVTAAAGTVDVSLDVVPSGVTVTAAAGSLTVITQQFIGPDSGFDEGFDFRGFGQGTVVSVTPSTARVTPILFQDTLSTDRTAIIAKTLTGEITPKLLTASRRPVLTGTVG